MITKYKILMWKYNRILAIGFLTWLCACQGNNSPSQLDPNIHKGIALEKINTSQYTYLNVNEKGEEKWLAFPLTDVKVGETYYYTNEMLMENFVSKELGKTFEKVYFIQAVFTEPPTNAMNVQPLNNNPQPLVQEKAHTGSEVVQAEKQKIHMAPVNKGVSIATLMAGMDQYANKSLAITGKVTKFSPDIMGKNWVHIQDGTDYQGKFDLTITTSDMVKQGDMVTFEGTISLNKDFGAGYVYEIIMEDARLKKQ